MFYLNKFINLTLFKCYKTYNIICLYENQPLMIIVYFLSNVYLMKRKVICKTAIKKKKVVITTTNLHC